MSNLSVIEKGGKFVVAKNGEPILLPKTDGQTIVTEFESKQDAERYMSILSSLSKQKRYQKS
ncbi:MAG: hypothetical protein EBS98_08745 [Chitinophagia bacterium]|nr:hypothetical protein [Chitinophagia bacterium]